MTTNKIAVLEQDDSGDYQTVIDDDPHPAASSAASSQIGNPFGAEYTYAGTIHGTEKQSATDYPSHMYWGPADHRSSRQKFWHAAASVGPSFHFNMDAGYIVLNKDYNDVTLFVLAHERGHNLGYGHDDGGIMSWEWRETDMIHPTTRTIAANTDGLELLSWERSPVALRKLFGAWRQGHITTDDIWYLYRKWKNNPSEDDAEIYPTNEFVNVLQNETVHQGGDINLERSLLRRGNVFGGTQAWR